MEAGVDRDPAALADVREVLRTFSMESGLPSDRHVAIAAAAVMDFMLETLLRWRFARSDRIVRKAFGRSLQSLSDKIALAYCTGIIDRELERELRAVAGIRNEFAHNPRIGLLADDAMFGRMRALGIECERDGWEKLHKEFAGRLEGIVYKLWRIAVSLWWTGEQIGEIPLPSDSRWNSVMDTDLSVLPDLIHPDDVKRLSQFMIRTVGDLVGAGNAAIPSIVGGGKVESELVSGVIEWAAEQLHSESG